MFDYLLRRCAYSIPLLIGINLMTFLLFFVVNSPDDMARLHLGEKHVTQEVIEQWKMQHGYDKPMFYAPQADGIQKFTETLFFDKSMRLLVFQFGLSDAGRDIKADIYQRAWPSLAIAVPTFFLGLMLHIVVAMIMAYYRETSLDLLSVVVCIALMSISGLFYIIGGQFLFAKVFRWVPISGYDGGFGAFKFIVLPMMVALAAGLGSGARWYRALFLEQLRHDYVKTARAKGLTEFQILWRHVLKNTMLPILTGVVVIIPSLFMGSLVLESFFGIPGLGSYMIDAIGQQDFAIVRVMVFLGSVAYLLGLILTDVAYVWVDPRVRLS